MEKDSTASLNGKTSHPSLAEAQAEQLLKEGELANGTSGKEGEIETFPITVKTCGEIKASIPLQVSPVDNLQDIRQFLFESVDTCFVTCYSLQHHGRKLNDFSDVGDIQGVGANSIIEMVEGIYDERGIRLHVRRLREILTPPSNSVSLCLFSEISGVSEENDVESISGPPSLGAFYPPRTVHSNPCINSIVFSGWNPPPGYRKLAGDLVYLEIVTLEGKTVHVTGSSTGFFINNSTQTAFDPTMNENSCKSHSLAALLGKLSPLFKKNFKTLLSTNFQEHPFEVLPVPFPVVPWTSKRENHSFDVNRAEDAILLSSETDMRGQLRDWNEEYQSCKELPSNTIQERIIRDRALVKVNCDFVEAATKGACAIIERSIPPINPLDPEKAHMYIYNNIFFSYSLDGRDFYKEYGGDKTAYVSANNDLKGIKAFNKADVKGLCTLCTAIIDYRGKRLCAQSIIPGILQREQTSTVVYGSIDTGKKISSDPTFHELLCKVGKELHIKEHTVLDEEGKEAKLCSALESKGITGTDGRKYVLDLIRTTPRDFNYPGKINILTVLRPELIQTFCEYLREKDKKSQGEKPSDGENTSEKPVDGEKPSKQEEVKKEEVKKEEAKKEEVKKEEVKKEEVKKEEVKKGAKKEGAKKEAKKKEEKKEEVKKEGAKKETKKASKEKKSNGKANQEPEVKQEDDPSVEEKERENAEALEELQRIAFNPNVLCDFKMGGTKEETEKDEALVKEAASFLVDTVIPMMIEDFSWFLSMPVDGQTLTSVMHSRGINMRYLGKVATLAEQNKLSIIQELSVREMITRAAKHVMRTFFVDIEDFNLAPLISHFLNCFLGNAPEPQEQEKKVKKNVGNKKKGKKSSSSSSFKPDFSLSTLKLWKQIRTEVKERFQYELPEREVLGSIVHCIPTLRSICQKVGIQIEAKDYNFEETEPFKPEDILQLFPILKHTNPESADGKNLLEAGKSFLAQGRIDIAYELLTEALAIFHQVYGPMHRDTAMCYGNLAMVLYHAKDVTQALDHQQKATIINERVQGLDHHDTSHSYGNLALFCHNMAKTSLALQYIRRALYLGRLVCGPNHPDIATTFSNIAMMLQDLSKHKEAIDYLMQALKSYETILGPNHLQTATIYHTIAIAYSQLEQFKEALAYEKKNYAILHSKVGDSDIRAVESNIWLRQFTQKAVALQMETQKAQRDIQLLQQQAKAEQLKNISMVGKATTPVQNVPPPTKAAPIVPPTNMGNRPLQELLAYINEKPSVASGSSFSQRNQKKYLNPVLTSIPSEVTSDVELNAKKATKKKKPKSKKEEEE